MNKKKIVCIEKRALRKQRPDIAKRFYSAVLSETVQRLSVRIRRLIYDVKQTQMEKERKTGDEWTYEYPDYGNAPDNDGQYDCEFCHKFFLFREWDSDIYFG